jgi:predicted TIM-barrel fold metal-dependent hydrolase
MTDLPFVDTHVHFWNLTHPTLRWVWLEPDFVHPLMGDIDGLKRLRFTADDYIAQTRFTEVSKVIHVQAALGSPDPVEETAWLEEMADRTGVPNGIVAEAWLSRPDVEAQLERHAQFPRLRGIRDFGEGEYLEDPAWERGYAALERFGLVCCLDSEADRFAKARALAERHPGVRLCLDHCGVPLERTDAYFDHWRTQLRDLALAPNVVVKVSGLGMRDPAWTIESIRPWVLECIDAFGPSRAVFATNWPVDSQFSDYGDVVRAYRTILAEFSESEQAAMLAGNAERIFRI